MRQIEFLAFVLQVLENLNIKYAIVGSYASSAWGEPRMTRDVDIVVSLTEQHVDPLCDAFPDADFYVSRTAAREAIRQQSQFNLIHPSSGNKIDFMIAGSDRWATTQLARRREIKFDASTSGFVAAPEDVILGKLIYYRDGKSEKHLRDIRGILKLSGDALDKQYVADRAKQLGVDDIWANLASE